MGKVGVEPPKSGGSDAEVEEMPDHIVKRYRRSRGLTQQQLGTMVGMSSAAISQWERGDTVEPSRERVAAVDEALGAEGAILTFYGFTPPVPGDAGLVREMLDQFAQLQEQVGVLSRQLDQAARRIERLEQRRQRSSF